MAKLDGLGEPIDPDGKYYIQDTRDVVGNCVSWWCPKGAGYTCEISQAGIYKGSNRNVSDGRSTDVPWPVNVVRGVIVKHVRIEALRRLQPERKV